MTQRPQMHQNLDFCAPRQGSDRTKTHTPTHPPSHDIERKPKLRRDGPGGIETRAERIIRPARLKLPRDSIG